MRSLLLILGLALSASATSIWPLPTSSSLGTEDATVPSLTFSSSSSGDLSKEVQAAVDRFAASTFTHIPSNADASSIPVTVTVDNSDAELQLYVDESYTLSIPEDGSSIAITAPTQFGFYHALSTLSQIIGFDYDTETYYVDVLPVAIKDTPRFPHRGVLIDTSRHYEPLPTIFRVIDSLAIGKLNVLHWHLVDSQSFPFDSPSYPLLGKAGAYSANERYTPSDLKQVVSYGLARGIRVMVEIDTPGHAASWCNGYPEICPDVASGCMEPLNPAVNATFDLIEGLFGDLNEIFPEKLMHLGGDEVNTDCWDKTEAVSTWMADNNLDSSSTYAYFIAKVQKIAQNLGKDVIGWEEIWNNFGTQLDPSTIIHLWLSGSDIAPDVTAAGYRMLWSSSDKWYLDWLNTDWKTMYNADPCSTIDDDACANLMLGGEGCMWGETVDTSDILSTIWPRLGAISERLWSVAADTADADAAEPRYAEFRCHLNRQGIEAAPHANEIARKAPGGPGGCLEQRRH